MIEYIETRPVDEKVKPIKIRVDGLTEKERADIIKVLTGELDVKDLVVSDSDFDKTQLTKTTEKIYRHLCYHDIGGKSCEAVALS